jgi:hypothetical protein
MHIMYLYSFLFICFVVLCGAEHKSIPQTSMFLSELFNSFPHSPSRNTPVDAERHLVLAKWHKRTHLVTLVFDDLLHYWNVVLPAAYRSWDSAEQQRFATPTTDWDDVRVPSDGRWSHRDHITRRLNFLRYVLVNGRLGLTPAQTLELWELLYPSKVTTPSSSFSSPSLQLSCSAFELCLTSFCPPFSARMCSNTKRSSHSIGCSNSFESKALKTRSIACRSNLCCFCSNL